MLFKYSVYIYIFTLILYFNIYFYFNIFYKSQTKRKLSFRIMNYTHRRKEK